MSREQEGRETAWERYRRLHAAGKATGDWSRHCTVIDYCTRPCDECAGYARQEREREASRVAADESRSCANCGQRTYELSRNGYCASCAEEHEPDWFEDAEVSRG